MTIARLAVVLLVLLVGCERSRVTEVPVAPPPVVHERPDLSGEIATVHVTAGADASHLHLVVVREGHDPRDVEVAAHPSAEELTAAFAGVSHDTRVVVAPDPALAHGDAVAVMDALRQAGYARFALSR